MAAYKHQLEPYALRSKQWNLAELHNICIKIYLDGARLAGKAMDSIKLLSNVTKIDLIVGNFEELECDDSDE